MAKVLQILSSNYSGESVNITFNPLIGSQQFFENVTLPYNFINETFDGNYTLFFPDYNLTHKFQIPTVEPVNTKCRCTEFSYNSFLGGTSKITYRDCSGALRKLTLQNRQSFTECVRLNEYTANTPNTLVTTYGFCNSFNDCITLTQPPTPTPTKTPTPTLSLTPTNTNTPSVTKTPTNTVTPTNTQTQTITPTYTQTPTNTQTVTKTTTTTPTTTPTTTQYTNCLSLALTTNPSGWNDYEINDLSSGVYLYNTQTNTVISAITLNGFDTNLITRNTVGQSSAYSQQSGSTGLAHYYDTNTQTGMMWIKNFNNKLYEFTLGVNYEATLVDTYDCPGDRLALKNFTTLITITGNTNNAQVIEIDISGPSPVLIPKFQIPFTLFTQGFYAGNGGLIYNTQGKLIFLMPYQAAGAIAQFDYETGELEYFSGQLGGTNPGGGFIGYPGAIWTYNGTLNAIHTHGRMVFTPQDSYLYLSGVYYGCTNQGGSVNIWGAGCPPLSVASPPADSNFIIAVSNDNMNCNDVSIPPNNLPTPTSTPTVTQTPTQTITPTSLCRCTTITNLSSSSNTITYQYCGYIQSEPVLVGRTLNPNEVIRDCIINETVVGDNILVSYDGGICQQVGGLRVCPELPLSPTPTVTNTQTPTPTKTFDDGQNIILVSGRKTFPDLTSQSGIFKYNYLSNEMSYLGIVGSFAGVSHTYDFSTNTGKIWLSNGGTIFEYNILNSNLENELNRIITLTGSGYGRNLTFKNETTLIKTILVNGERWVAEIDITELNINPITTLKFRITNTNSNDDTVLTDLMYTNTERFIWTNGVGVVTLQQYNYGTGELEFDSVVSLQPASLLQREGEIISIQTAPVRVSYNLTTADDTIICPNIICGPTIGPSELPFCTTNNCNNYDFMSYGASSLLMNNNSHFVPNQVCPIIDDFTVSQDFDTVMVQNNTEYDLNVFTKTSTALIGTVLSGQVGQFPSSSFEESIVGVVPTNLEYFSTCRVCKDVFNTFVDCETGCGSLDGLQMSKTNTGESLIVVNNSTSSLLFYDSVSSIQQLFEVEANTGTYTSPSSNFQYGIIVIGVTKIDGTVCKTCFRLDNLSEIPCDFTTPSILLSGILTQNNSTLSNGVYKYDFLSNTVTHLNILGNQLTGLAHYYNNNSNTGFIWTKRSTEAKIKEYLILNSNYDNQLNREIILTGTNYGTSLTYINNTTLVTTKKIGNEQWIVEINIDPSLPNPIDTLKFQISFGNSDIDGDLMYTNTGKLIMSSQNGNYKIMEQYVYSTGYREFVTTICCGPVALWQFYGGIYSSQSGAGQIVRYDLVGDPEMVFLLPTDSNFVRPPIQCGVNLGEPLNAPDSSTCQFSFLSNAGSSLLIDNNTEFVPNLF